MGLPQTIRNAHRQQLKIHGVDVVYRSRVAGDLDVRALRKQSFARMQETDGSYTTTVADDWHIAAENLVDEDGAKVTPADGDSILYVDEDGLVTAFDVLPWADEPARHFADVTRQIHNVHTKQTRQYIAGQLLAEDGTPLCDEAGALLISEEVTV